VIRRPTRAPLAVLLVVLWGLCACQADGSAAPSIPPDSDTQPALGAWSPAQSGLIAATGDPAVMPSTPGFSPGVLYVSRVYVDQTRAAHTAQAAVITAGAGISHAFIGVYDPAGGRLLASTGDVSAALSTEGVLQAPLTSELAAQPRNKELWLVLLIGGMAKSPTVIGGREYGSNLGLTGDYRLWTSSGSTFTSLPAAIPPLKVPSHGSIPFLAVGP
jgi:uncharacterized membrane protein YfcA